MFPYSRVKKYKFYLGELKNFSPCELITIHHNMIYNFSIKLILVMDKI